MAGIVKLPTLGSLACKIHRIAIDASKPSMANTLLLTRGFNFNASLYTSTLFICKQRTLHQGKLLLESKYPLVSVIGMKYCSSSHSGPDLDLRHPPSDMDKKMLVWARSYKAVDDVPETVSYPQMKRAKDYFRIRVSLMMIAATIVGCVIMIWSGRRARDSGDSLTKREIARANYFRQKGLQEREEAAAPKEA